MKKKKILLFMYTVLFMVCFFSGLNGLGRVSATDGDPNSEEEGIDYNYNEEGELMEGDEGLSDEVLDALYSPDPSTAFLDVKEVTDRARTMAVTAIEYNGQIPFVKDKTEFQKGYSPLYCFYPDSERTTTFGMGYEGYIQWLNLVKKSKIHATKRCASRFRRI